MRQDWDAYGRSIEKGPGSIALRVTFGLMFLTVLLGVFGYAFDFIALPAREELRRKTWEESQSHVQGTIRALTRLRLEYTTASSEGHRKALRQMALTQASEVDPEDLPADLQAWLNSIR